MTIYGYDLLYMQHLVTVRDCKYEIAEYAHNHKFNDKKEEEEKK
jgi:hypothetical protein